MIDIFLADWKEHYMQMPEKSIDMVLCDLPYGATKNKNDIPIPFDILWRSYDRVVKENGAIVLFGQGLFFSDLIQSNRRMFRYDMVWDKVLTSGFLNANKMPLRVHENIAVFYKKPPVYHPQKTKGPKSHSKGTLHLTKDAKNQNYGKFKSVDSESDLKHPKSIISVQKPHPSVALHVTEKPVELLKRLILTYTNPGDAVLDNTMGSGGTGIACIDTGRRFYGVEMDEPTFYDAKKRITNHKL